jgi:hypothetical protein
MLRDVLADSRIHDGRRTFKDASFSAHKRSSAGRGRRRHSRAQVALREVQRHRARARPRSCSGCAKVVLHNVEEMHYLVIHV